MTCGTFFKYVFLYYSPQTFTLSVIFYLYKVQNLYLLCMLLASKKITQNFNFDHDVTLISDPVTPDGWAGAMGFHKDILLVSII